MLAIRLQRVGKAKFPTYRLIVSEKSQDTHDVYVEQLGTYNPQAKENAFQPNAERIQYWIGKGAAPSPTVHNLLVTAGIVKGEKKRSVFLSKKRKAKIAAKQPAAPAPAAEPAAPSAA